MKAIITLFTFLSIALPVVHAHGYLSAVTIDGKTYRGNVPRGASKASPIRQVNSVEPVKGAKNPAINCGPEARPASQTVTARAGSSISFRWSGGDGSNWPHDTGPMLVYAARCQGSCTNYNSANARWFKIDQVGKQGNQWAQKQLMNGGVHTSKIPSNLAPGEYLIRHEIIGLHLASQRGGAEFYDGCVQVKVTGSGTGAPAPNELVSLPGAYSDDSPSIKFNAFGGGKYTFPGPAISKLSARSTASLSARTNETEVEEPQVEDTSLPQTPKRHHPRVISRVMRGLHAH